MNKNKIISLIKEYESKVSRHKQNLEQYESDTHLDGEIKLYLPTLRNQIEDEEIILDALKYKLNCIEVREVSVSV